MKSFLLFYLLCFSLAYGQFDFSRFDSYQGRLTRDAIEKKIAFYLQKDGEIGSYFTLTDELFTLFEEPETTKDRIPCYVLKLTKKVEDGRAAPTKKKSLKDIKVAIDPGHLGAPFAHLEDRYIEIPSSLNNEASVCFDEGTLSMLTAWHLRSLLQKEGVSVLLTRDGLGKGSMDEDFFSWLKNHPDLWTSGAHLKHLFNKHYLPLDLRARAQKVNDFEPDLTIVIHYNGHEEKGSSSNSDPSMHNYNMVFGPGSFCKKELAVDEARYEFLRLLLSDDIEASIALGKLVVKHWQQGLNVPPVSKHDHLPYLDKVSMKVEEGVYLRNLALTRLVHSPVCYGESLVQNHVEEYRNLGRQDCVIEGVKCSSRIKQVAEGYFNAIVEYLQEDKGFCAVSNP